jgi:predicted dehydrogenase
MRFLNRRDFLIDSILAAGAVAGAGLLGNLAQADEKTETKKDGANDQLRVAVVGVNGRGMSHVGAFSNNKQLNTVITHVCDADSAVIGKAMTKIEKDQGKAPVYVQDFRKLLEDKNIDIVSIATPNHWHSLMGIWAMQADKDVYVEKPVSHNVHEGRILTEAARKYKRICQGGTQCRSTTGMRQFIDFVRSGGIGTVKIARGLCYKSRGSIGVAGGEQPIPATVDYDLWCGPAAKKPLTRKRLHYDWHWIWEYGNGDLGNQGIHQMDIARWGLGKEGLPKSVVSVGGRFGYVDDGQTANTQICVFDYGDSELIFEVRGLKTDPLRGAGVGDIFYGSEGYAVTSSYGGGKIFDKDGKLVKEFKGGDDSLHFANFIKAVRSRKRDEQNAEVLETHLSSALCHLGNISYRLGTEQPFDKKCKAFGDDKDAAETFERMQEHLKDNKVALDETKYRVGRKLTVDTKTEKFVEDKEANALLTREPRKGFEVPEKL